LSRVGMRYAPESLLVWSFLVMSREPDTVG
jgi:hypothetical protein